MIPNPNRSVFPKNRTWFALLMLQKSGRAEIYHILFYTEAEAHGMGSDRKERRMLHDFKVYPVRPDSQDVANYKPLWY